ncbi:hypothetical protein DWB58_10265 [candidate division KSB1 bacterium]|nr:hypothetical protein [candidate division KSB1 bacterium]MDL1875379.1 hypothetical protein [Cytophagia bacterium CHB2]
MRYRNEFKRLDVFRCRHDSHEKFEYRVSAFHILERKQCFPGGCVYFRWRCKLFEKGKPCYRGYQHVGRLCEGCQYFLDEKVNNRPELRIPEAEYEEWRERYKDFAEWVERMKGREASVLGVITAVKPRFQKFLYPKTEELRLRGFQVAFSEAFVDLDHLDDDCYAVVSRDFQDRHQLAPGAKIEFRGRFTLNRGRVVFEKIRRVEIVEPPHAKAEWNSSTALVARSVATGFDWQPAKCLQCQYGVLADVEDRRQPQTIARRQLYCLQGMPHPDVCPIVPGRSLGEDECQK